MSDDDSEDPLAIALEDARRLVDQQDGLMERNERELVRIIWLNVLLLGGMVPALEVLRPEDGTFFKSLDPGLPWFVLAVFLIIMAIFFGSLTYRGNLLHGGFEDSPNLAVADLTWKSLGGPAEDDFPGVDAFDADATENAEAMRARLLWDYGKGIRHNNRETTYRFQVVDWVTRLMVLGIVWFVSGALAMVGTDYPSIPDGVDHWMLLSGALVLSALWVLITLRAYRRFICRQWDDDRYETKDFGDHHESTRWTWLWCWTPVRTIFDRHGIFPDRTVGTPRRSTGDTGGGASDGGGESSGESLNEQ